MSAVPGEGPDSSGSTWGAGSARAAGVARWLQIAGGAASLVIGALVLAWPDVTVVVIAVLLAIHLLLNGALRLVSSLLTPSLTAERRIVHALVGVLWMAVGVLFLRDVATTVTVLTLLLGLAWLIGGILEVVASFTSAAPGWSRSRLVDAVTGAIAAVGGVLVLVFPGQSLVALTILAGIWLVVYGATAVVGALP